MIKTYGQKCLLVETKYIRHNLLFDFKRKDFKASWNDAHKTKK